MFEFELQNNELKEKYFSSITYSGCCKQIYTWVKECNGELGMVNQLYSGFYFYSHKLSSNAVATSRFSLPYKSLASDTISPYPSTVQMLYKDKAATP